MTYQTNNTDSVSYTTTTSDIPTTSTIPNYYDNTNYQFNVPKYIKEYAGCRKMYIQPIKNGYLVYKDKLENDPTYFKKIEDVIEYLSTDLEKPTIHKKFLEGI